MSEKIELTLDLPTDLFNPNRMPARDTEGYVCHPDWDLVYEKLGIEDEGEAANEYFRSIGYEYSIVELEDDASEEINNRHFELGDPNVADWIPTIPTGEGWTLLSIYMHDDGTAACFTRLKP